MKTKTSTPFLLASLALGLMAVSCDKKPPQPTTQSAKHYHLKGKIVSIDKQGKMLNVDSESIPGFMDAMTMPYKLNRRANWTNCIPAMPLRPTCWCRTKAHGSRTLPSLAIPPRPH